MSDPTAHGWTVDEGNPALLAYDGTSDADSGWLTELTDDAYAALVACVADAARLPAIEAERDAAHRCVGCPHRTDSPRSVR